MRPMIPAQFSRSLFTSRTALAAALSLAGASLTGCGSTDGYYAEARAPQAEVQYDAQAQVDVDAQAQAQAEAQAPVDTGDSYQDTDPSALSDFREPLQPYGVWVEDPTYGTVWVPSAEVVGGDFAPYQTAGHWALTDDEDWIWVSDYDWGYIPFHYGRWVWIAGRGWAWIPGHTYAPAWVVWRTGDMGYVGWAPMPPAWYWYDGYATALWVVPPAAFVFCSSRYVFHDHVSGYIVRDHEGIRTAAGGTHPYHPATPTVGNGRPNGPHYSAVNQGRPGVHMSPTLQQAGINPATAGATRVGHDARATTFASHSALAQARATGATPAPHFQQQPSSPATMRRPDPIQTRGSSPAISGARGRDVSAQHAPPQFQAQPQQPQQPRFHSQAPAIHTPPRVSNGGPSSPHFSGAPPAFHSAPSGGAGPAIHPGSTSRPVAPAPRSAPATSGSHRSGGHHR